MQIQIGPSILSADFLNLGRDIQLLNPYADFFHMDIMDGSFVPNISFGFPIVGHVGRLSSIPMDAHLMVVHPERWFKALKDNGAEMVSFHWEAAKRRTAACIKEIHSLGMKAGVVINPDIPVSKLFPYIGKADYFVIMSVFAGFAGQKFIPESASRVAELRAELDRRGFSTPIEIDGGINTDTAAAARAAGADMLVAGSFVFKSSDPVATIAALRGE